MVINEQHGSTTTLSGSASENLLYNHSEIRQIYVEATTSSTTFDVTITNNQGIDVYVSNNNTGKVTENAAMPMRGNGTLTISNASADEGFNYYISAMERYD